MAPAGESGELVASYRERAASLRGRRVRATVSSVVLGLDMVVVLLVLANVHGPVRYVLGLAFALLGPGWAIVGLVRLEHAALEFSLAVATGLAVLMLLAQLAMTVGAWRLTEIQLFVCVACVPSLLWQSLDRQRLLSGQP